MKFLKNIVMVALATTALSAGAMAMDMTGNDQPDFVKKVGLTAGYKKKGEAVFEVTEALVGHKGDLAKAGATNKVAKTVMTLEAHLIAALEGLAGDEATLVQAIKDNGNVLSVKLDSFDAAADVEELKKAIAAAANDQLANKFFVKSAEATLIEELVAIDPTEEVIVTNKSGDKKMTVKDIADQYAAAGKDKGRVAKIDAIVKAAKTEKDASLADLRARLNTDYGFVAPGKMQEFKAKLQVHSDRVFEDGKKAAKPSAKHEAGASLIDALEQLRTNEQTFDDSIDLKTSAGVAAFVQYLTDLDARVATLQTQLGNVTKERDIALAAGAPGGTMPGLGGKGGTGGGKVGKLKMTKRQVQDHMEAVGLGGSHAEVAASLGAELVD